MKQETNRLRITKFTAELSSKYLIIIFMNEVPVIEFQTQAGVPVPNQPDILATGSVRSAYKGKVMEMKWVLYKDITGPTGLKLSLVIFDVEESTVTIYSAEGGGKVLRNHKKENILEFPIHITKANTIAEQIAATFIKKLKGEENANS